MKNKPIISDRGNLAPYSPIRKLSSYAEGAKNRGIKIFHLNIGQPDFEIPAKIRQEIKKRAKIKYLPYSNSQGSKELIDSWLDYYKNINVIVVPEDIVITYGASEALIFAMAAVCDPLDELIVFEPFYANYNGFANLVSAKIKSVPLDINNGYHLPPEKEIVKQITKKTKAICIINPNNPSGTVFSEKELLSIINVAKKHNLFIIADETYYGICFDGVKMKGILEIAKGLDRDRIIVVDSVSKRLNVCGARVGALVSTNKEIISAVLRFAQERLAVATFEQEIVASELKDSLPYVKQITADYQIRRDVLIKTLERELDIKIHKPEGAFYIMLKLPFRDSDNFAKWLLEDFSLNKETVMVAPGSGFYNLAGYGEDEIRLAYVLKPKELKKAAIILAQAILEYSEKFHKKASKSEIKNILTTK